MADEPADIPADFHYKPHHVEVAGTRIHYLDEGAGEPVVFLHGNPTWSYLWRNVIPHVAPHARCIAPDLAGMGRSGKPDSAYRFFDHYDYIAGFIEALGLTNVTFVAHDWGGALAFHYFARNPERVRALAFFETMPRPLAWGDLPLHYRPAFVLMRTPGLGWFLVSVLNLFVEVILRLATRRRLGINEMAHYREPFRSVGSRRPVRQWPCEIPFSGRPADVDAAFRAYSTALRGSDLPKLLLYARPGALVGPGMLAWCREHLPNLETIDIGPGKHYLPEDQPDAIGRAVADWFQRLPA